MSNKNLMVWTCKIVVEGDELPHGFDFPPRRAAQNAIESCGFNVIMNSSGWGGELDEYDKKYLEKNGYKRNSAVDAPEDTTHNEMKTYLIKEIQNVNSIRAGYAVNEPSLYEAQCYAIRNKFFHSTTLTIEDESGDLICYLEDGEWNYIDEIDEQNNW